MIQKWYEVSCDICGIALNHYIALKPTPTKLRHDGIKVIINNGKVHTYCEECYKKIKGNIHDNPDLLKEEQHENRVNY